jgi:CARDB protein
MRRVVLTVTCFALLAAPARAAPVRVVLSACAPADRAAEFEAQMGEVAGAARLRMRWTLQARRRGQRAYHRVAAPGLKGWSTAHPGTRRYVFTRRVEALIGPARYRALVRFQWLNAHGTLVARAKRHSRACRQPDHRANLRVTTLSHKGRHRYLALIVNNGRTASGAFDLQMAVGGTVLEPLAVAGLGPGEQRLVTAFGPRCEPDTAITATADALDVVDERSEADNALTVPCA